MQITGTHIHYYMLCHRKLWLFANNIQMEHTSDIVAEGKFIHETTYKNRSLKFSEIEIEGIKIDYFDHKNKVVHEIKKSNKCEEVHQWQLKYYLFVLEKNGITGAIGLLEYPKMRITKEVLLSEADKKQFEKIIIKVQEIILNEQCPPRLNKKQCRNCSYFDFCWSSEPETDNI
jgi:CRISPR-associated exonuclease Cas4